MREAAGVAATSSTAWDQFRAAGKLKIDLIILFDNRINLEQQSPVVGSLCTEDCCATALEFNGPSAIMDMQPRLGASRTPPRVSMF